MLMRKMVVLVKQQPAKGTPATPTKTDDAIMARTAMPSPIKAQYLDRELLRAVKGQFGKIVTGEHGYLEFETEIAGSGAAGTAPAIAPLLLASGHSETVNSGVSVVYDLHSSDSPYFTVWCYLDKVLFAIQDAWMGLTTELNANGIPVDKWRVMGKYVAPSDANAPADADFSAFVKPIAVGKANTPTFTVHGVAVKANALSVDYGIELEWRDILNDAGVLSDDRQPSARCSFELTTVAVMAWAETVRQNTEGAIQLVHGTAAGNIVQLDMPKAQFSADPDIQRVGKRAFLNGQFSLNPDAGNDEIVRTYK